MKSSIPPEVLAESRAQDDAYEERLVAGLASLAKKSGSMAYRKLALAECKGKHGQLICVHCGFGVLEVLEVAHLDCDRSNNDLENLAVLCRNCHRMYDLDLISREVILTMRDRPKIVNTKKLMKDAGVKAAIGSVSCKLDA